jgi:integrase
MGKLTARQAATLGPGKHNDGNGLWLAVSKTGSRKWFLRITVDGKRREMGLGSLADVSLKEAREKAAQARSQAAQGVDPVEARHQVELKVPTFTQVAASYIRAHRRSWQNPKHQRQWVSTLKTYARPIVGNIPIDQVGTEHVLKILTPIWTAKTETAKRVQGRVENILDYAAARKWRDTSNPARWRGHLDKLLPSPMKVKRQQNGGVARHQPALDYRLVPEFMVELRKLGSISAWALEFAILNASRTSEVIKAQWSEIDMERAQWVIPAQRMKARREHRVPLSDAAMAVLAAVPRVDGNPHVFPGRRDKPLSSMAMLQCLRGLGHGVGGDKSDATVHGFRSSFRDWAGEVATFPSNVAEAALAHVIGDKTEAAYARGDLFEKRRRLMEQWSTWCARGSIDNVVELHQQANG